MTHFKGGGTRRNLISATSALMSLSQIISQKVSGTVVAMFDKALGLISSHNVEGSQTHSACFISLHPTDTSHSHCFCEEGLSQHSMEPALSQCPSFFVNPPWYKSFPVPCGSLQ
ncbi:DEP domain-containing protein 5 [Platysternon megacephalum]|uniref:DEP domain-containing protein 5 n=1 Tax=Platysternon megacephalum TaxID=55544 RepID=A0A4D9DZW8_9SAUR|nr:DEP domain-containing protein 5 [Platysternon megacephalum]